MTGSRGSDRSDTNEILRASSQFMGHGLTFAVATLLFMLGGNWADGKLGTGPWLAIAGTLIGASAGFYSLYRHVVAVNEVNRAKDAEREGKG